MDQTAAIARVAPRDILLGPAMASARTRRRIALGLAALSCVAGFALAGAWPAPAGAEHDLLRLLRLMAVLKLGTAAGAAWLVDWRLRAPATPRFALGYAVSVALMAAAPGLIWRVTPVIEGAAVFHAGLIAFLLLAYADRDGAQAAFAVSREVRSGHDFIRG